MVGTVSRNRNIAQKSHGSLKDNLEKLFRRGRGLSKRAMVALGNGFWEDEMVFAMHIDQGVTLHFTLRRKNATARRFQCSQWCDGAVKPVAHISSHQMRPSLTRYDPSLLSHLCQKDVSLFFEGADHLCNDFGGNATRFAHPLEELLKRGAVSLDAMYRSPQCFAGKPIG